MVFIVLIALGAWLYSIAWRNVRREWDDGEREIELQTGSRPA
jgi:hypothetical protein